MGQIDLKFWFGVGLALVSYALPPLGAPEGLAYITFFGGIALMAVSAMTALLRRLPGSRKPEGSPTTNHAKVAEENRAISYTFHGGAHNHYITIVEQRAPAPRFRMSTPMSPDSQPTFVKFRTDGLVLLDSHNVSSVADNGTGDFTISFVEALKVGALACHALPPTPNTFQAVLDADGGSVRVVFEGAEPEIIALRFSE